MAFINEGSADYKQHINLSNRAWSILENDMFCFYDNTDSPDKSKMTMDRGGFSGILNKIFEQYYEEAAASVSIRLEEKNRELQTLFDNTSKEASKELANKGANRDSQAVFLEKILKAYGESLLAKATSHKKGEGRKFRLNKKNFTYLTEGNSLCGEDLYYKNIGTYLKAIFEEYSLKPYIEREAIFFRDYIHEVEMAMELGVVIAITLQDGTVFEVLPHSISMDKLSTFHYLIGYSKSINAGKDANTDKNINISKNGSEWTAASFRISRLRNIQLLKGRKESLSEQQKEHLEKQIAAKGIPFLASDLSEIHVLLSPEGKKKYNTQITLRPPYESIKDSNIYIFKCTKRQIEYYFFKFGKDAIILYPPDLANHFKTLYKETLENYYSRPL